MAGFLRAAERLSQQRFSDYESLWVWSVDHFEDFWTLWLRESGTIYEGMPLPVFEAVASGVAPGHRWFRGLSLNYAENCVRGFGETPLVAMDEKGRVRRLSREDCLRRIRGLQLFFKAQGVQAGDVVAGLLPNVPEAVLAMLAASSLGAVWSSCSPDFGVQGILDRFEQIKPKVLLLADGCYYGGKTIDLADKNAQVLAGLPSVQATLTVSHVGLRGDWAQKIQSDGTPIEFARLPFSHPLYVLFSSGTTGKPKCIVHGAGGMLLQHQKELALQGDIREGESLLYYTTCGWMMWNWMASAVSVGATVWCYDGSPAAPNADSLWKLVSDHEIEFFGTSAKFIAMCRIQGVSLQNMPFTKLRRVFSTGSPLAPEDFDYFYEQVRPQNPLPLASISGGTDICSCFMLGTPLKPVVRGEIQARGLGMDVHAFDATGQPVVGEKGELVCTKPFPAMPVSFFGDRDGSKYRKAYFERFPGVWHHGDYVTITPQGGVVIHGRSDATLNPGGVRIGTAEIYRQVEKHPAVQDSLVVGQQWDGDERVVLFVKLKDPKAPLTETLVKEIKDAIRAGASPRHVPAKILLVADIPYTVSGKKVELAVKALIHGETPTNLEALANPAALGAYKNRPELAQK